MSNLPFFFLKKERRLKNVLFMKKFNSMVVSYQNFGDYYDCKKEIDVVIMDTLEENMVAMFEVVSSDVDKAFYLAAFSKFWDEAEELAVTNGLALHKKRIEYRKEFYRLANAEGFWQKLKARIKIFLMEPIHLKEFLACYMWENPNEDEKTREKIMKTLDREWRSYSDLKPNFMAEDIRRYRPLTAPSSTAFYFGAEDVPYLKILLQDARKKGYTQQDILEAWDACLHMKSMSTSAASWSEIGLDKALCVLFESLSYYDTKRHYVALISLSE